MARTSTALLVVGRAVGEFEADQRGLSVRRQPVRLQRQEFALADREGDIHRVVADDLGQHAGIGADDITHSHLGAADPAGDRRPDLGVAEIDLGGLQVGGGRGFVALRALLVGDTLVADGDRAGIRLQQVLGTLALHRGVLEGALGLLERALRLLDRGLERAALDAEERSPLGDGRPVLEQDLFEIAGDAGADVDTVHRLDPPDEIGGLGDGALLGDHGADGNGGGRRLLGEGARAEAEDEERRERCGGKAQGRGEPLRMRHPRLLRHLFTP